MKLNWNIVKDKILGINDTRHRIALGFGLGLFLGVFPGTGAIAAVVGAFIVRANKAAALTGALLVNTWINVVTFPVAVAIGAFLFGIDPAALTKEWTGLIRHFTWKGLFDTVMRDTVLALGVGYTLIGAVGGVFGYAVCFAVVTAARKKKTTRGPHGVTGDHGEKR